MAPFEWSCFIISVTALVLQQVEATCERQLVPPSTILLEPEVHVRSVDKSDTARLPCRLCDAPAPITGRQWFKRLINATFILLTLDTRDDQSKNRRYVTADHTLVIRNITEKDVGYYICHDNEEPPTQYRMEYLLDVSVPSKVDPVSGDLIKHRTYLRELRETYGNMTLEGILSKYNVTTSWSEWSSCDRCGEIGLRKRHGRCQLTTSIPGQVILPQGTQGMANVSVPILGPSCRSLLLRHYKASKKLYRIPDYVHSEYCEEPCDEGFSAGQKMSTSNGSFFSWRFNVGKTAEETTAELAPASAFHREEQEDTSISLVCPGATPDSPVMWFFNSTKFRKAWRRVTVNKEGHLVFKQLKERDTGIYECTVMGVKVGHLQLQVKKKPYGVGVLATTSGMWMAYFTITVNVVIYTAVVLVNCKHHYRRMEIQEHLARARRRRKDADSADSRESDETL